MSQFGITVFNRKMSIQLGVSRSVKVMSKQMSNDYQSSGVYVYTLAARLWELNGS